METNRRGFMRLASWGVTGAVVGIPLAAWAQRIRILGEAPVSEHPVAPGSQMSPDFQRFLTGVRVGDARAHGGLRVFWLHGGAPAAALTVATLAEARSRGDLVVTERDQASVPELLVENRGKAHVLILAGEILLGGKQNRVVKEDILLSPGSGPLHVEVYCVEQGRWSGRTKGFEARGSFAAPRLRAKLMERADQRKVWAEVRQYTASAGAASPSDSYQAIYEKTEVQEHLEDMARGLGQRAAPGALGAAVFRGQTLLGLDLFFDPGLFAREWPMLLRAQALEVYHQPDQPEAGEGALRGRVEDLVRAAAKVEGGLRPTAGVGRLFEFRLESVRGSALLFDGRVVHTAIL